MKRTILLFITLNLLTFKIVAQQVLAASKGVAATADTAKVAVQTLDADSLYHANLIEQGKTHFVNKDSAAHFKGKRFEKAAVTISKKTLMRLSKRQFAFLKIRHLKILQMLNIEILLGQLIPFQTKILRMAFMMTL